MNKLQITQNLLWALNQVENETTPTFTGADRADLSNQLTTTLAEDTGWEENQQESRMSLMLDTLQRKDVAGDFYVAGTNRTKIKTKVTALLKSTTTVTSNIE